MRKNQMTELVYSVTDLQDFLNQTLRTAYSEVILEAEVANFKISHNKWVFFDLKDDNAVLSCFMSIFQLKTPIEDGMIIRAYCSPNITRWGKFSLTIRSYELAGAGSVKRAFELLKQKLQNEGLFLTQKKRPLPTIPQKVALITSAQAAAFNDFVSIINKRWGGLQIDHLQAQVQGEAAAQQICSAIEYLNKSYQDYDVLVIIRGGGSAEDLQVFQTEQVTRAVFGSKITTLVAIGHQDDVSLAELAADCRAATPSDAARILIPDKNEFSVGINALLQTASIGLKHKIASSQQSLDDFYFVSNNYIHLLKQKFANCKQNLERSIEASLQSTTNKLERINSQLQLLNPTTVLKKGYAIVSAGADVVKTYHQLTLSQKLMIQLYEGRAEAEVKKIYKR